MANTMDKGGGMNSTDLAKAVAAEILSGSSVWIFVILTALFAGAGAYFGKYLGIKAANLATREDFNTLHEQLGANTRLVESVKSEIARADWVAREWDSLRIKKIEELMTILHDCETHLEAARNSMMGGDVYQDTAPFDNALVVSELYLPELHDAVSLYIAMCRTMSIVLGKAFMKSLELQQSDINYDRSLIWGNVISESGYSELIYSFREVRQQASQLLQKIVSGQQPD